jgi:hypothetical protein
MRSIAIIAILFFTIKATGQNLIVNPGAEILPLTTNGWTIVTGFWTGSNTSQGEQVPHSGTYHFYAGDNSGTSELYQDIDVSSMATDIDAGNASFSFQGWINNFSLNNDEGRIRVEYRNASGVVLQTYDTMEQFVLVWTQYTDTRNAPANTRKIRIRLTTRRISGTGSDGYFDDLSLTVALPAPISLLYFETKALTNKDYFTVEKSLDGLNWETLSTIKGQGNSHTNKAYVSYDYSPIIGLQYYRLLQTDVGGKNTIYPTRSVNYNTSTDQIYIYKNEQNEILIHGTGILKVSVYTQDGVFVKRELFDESAENTELNVSQMPIGFLIFSIETANEIVNLKYVNK